MRLDKIKIAIKDNESIMSNGELTESAVVRVSFRKSQKSIIAISSKGRTIPSEVVSPATIGIAIGSKINRNMSYLKLKYNANIRPNTARAFMPSKTTRDTLKIEMAAMAPQILEASSDGGNALATCCLKDNTSSVI